MGQEVGAARVNFWSWRVKGADGPGLRRCASFEGAALTMRKDGVEALRRVGSLEVLRGQAAVSEPEERTVRQQPTP